MNKVKSLLHEIEINNQKQYYTIQSINHKNPLLLFLHGGPGGANIGMSSVLESKSSLTNHFSIIQYDQRGAGKSYNKSLTKADISLEIILDDILKLIDHLLKQYNQEKIYLVGHSFGTLLGMRVCQAIPNKIHAYLGISQMVNVRASEERCIEESLKLSDLKKNNKAKLLLESSIKHFNKGNYPEYIMDQRFAMTMIGGYTHNRKPMKPAMLYIVSAVSSHYSIADAIMMKKGLVFSTEMLWHEILDINLFEEIPSVDVPVYIIQCASDIVASPDIAREYLEQLKTLDKEFVLFEASGHSPQGEEVNHYENEVKRLFLNK